MDFFGIGHAMKCMRKTYSLSARQTGRTQALIESLKPGDRVVCVTHVLAKHLQRRCEEMGVDGVEFTACSPNSPDMLSVWKKSQGMTVLDHEWVEEYYMAAIDKAAADIDAIQARLSKNEALTSRSDRLDRSQRGRWEAY